MRALVRLPFGVGDEGPRLAFERFSELAEDHGLNAYGATHLELAMRRRLALASPEEALPEAAQRCRVHTLEVANPRR